MTAAQVECLTAATASLENIVSSLNTLFDDGSRLAKLNPIVETEKDEEQPMSLVKKGHLTGDPPRPLPTNARELEDAKLKDRETHRLGLQSIPRYHNYDNEEGENAKQITTTKRAIKTRTIRARTMTT